MSKRLIVNEEKVTEVDASEYHTAQNACGSHTYEARIGDELFAGYLFAFYFYTVEKRTNRYVKYDVEKLDPIVPSTRPVLGFDFTKNNW